MTNAKTTEIAEIVTFQLVDGVSDSDFLAAMAPSHAWASGSDGYVSRQLSKAQDGTWTDYTVWASMDHAQAAAGTFMAQDFAPGILAGINQETFTMRHQSILWAPA